MDTDIWTDTEINTQTDRLVLTIDIHPEESIINVL